MLQSFFQLEYEVDGEVDAEVGVCFARNSRRVEIVGTALSFVFVSSNMMINFLSVEVDVRNECRCVVGF